MLNGQIEVNGWPIGSWRAVRTDTAASSTADDPVHVYACVVELKGHRAAFEIEHRYGDGAAALAGAVLTRAAGLIPASVAEHDSRYVVHRARDATP